MTKSKFSLWVISATLVILVLSVINYIIFAKLIFADNNKISYGILIFIGLLLFTWLWLTFGELRTKIITVVIDSNKITKRNFWGLGRKVSFELSDFDGYKTAQLPSRFRTYENLYLVKDEKKKIKISQFYHHNYSELKIVLRENVKFIGTENINYINELKEIFE